MRREAQEYIDFLTECGYANTFPQKDARILFNSKHGKITSFLVADFSNPASKEYLYKEYDLDIGNCLSDWDKWTFADVLLKLFVSYDVPYDIRKHILFELSQVNEWRSQVSFWIWRNFSNQA